MRLTRRQRKLIQTVVEAHGMSYDTGKCLCGANLKGDFQLAEDHFHEEIFKAGYQDADRRQKGLLR